jgi:hypothetical protein
MDTNARIAHLRETGTFDEIEFENLRWSIILDSVQVTRLYATFSPISRLDFEKRTRLLEDLWEVAEKQFGGKVELNISTPIYTAQRRVVGGAAV